MSVLEFTAVFATALLMWSTATYVPAVTRWRAVMRVFAPILASCGAWIVTGVLAVLRYDKFRAAKFGFADSDWRQRHVLAVIPCVAMMVVLVFPARLFNYCETHSCGSLAPSSPCGACSCSSLPSAAAYHPAGWFDGTKLPFTEGRATVCVYRGCAWAPATNETVWGYPALTDQPGYPNTSAPACAGCGLATNRTQDYPNLGVGTVGPLLLGLNTTVRTTLCPGVRAIPGTGKTEATRVCGYCGPYWQKHKNVPLPPQCVATFQTDAWVNAGVRTTPALAEDDWLVCDLMCPSPSETSTPDAAAEQLSAAIIAVLVMVAEVVVQELVLSGPTPETSTRANDADDDTDTDADATDDDDE